MNGASILTSVEEIAALREDIPPRRIRLAAPALLLTLASIAGLTTCAPNGEGEPRGCHERAEAQPQCFPDEVFAECLEVEALCPHYLLVFETCPPSFDCMFVGERPLFLQAQTPACSEATACEVFFQAELGSSQDIEAIQQREGGECWWSEQAAAECDRYCPFREGQLHDQLVDAGLDPGPCDPQ